MDERPLAAIHAALWLVAADIGCSGSGGDSDDWYYHWNCHGDPECLSLGPGANGQASGTLNEGPVFANCSALLTFADHN